MTFEEVTAAMKVLSARLGGHLNMRACIAPELCALGGCGYFELCNRIDIDSVSELLVHAGICDRLAIHGEVVLVRSLPIECCRSAGRIGGSAGNGLQEARKITSV